MNKFLLVVLLQVTLGIVNSHAQNSTPSPLYLSNYSFSKEGDGVGYVRTRFMEGAQIKDISIEGDQSGAFRIGKDHQLSVRKEKLKPGVNWMDVVLKVKTTEGVLCDTFRIVQDGFVRNKVIAHRGAWKNTGVAENSVAALKHAIDMGCEGSEFDVHMSSDSIPFVNHDPVVQGTSIAKTAASQLQNIKLSNGESLPTLESYLRAGLEQNKTKLILEIKVSELGKAGSLALTHKVVEMVELLGAQAWVDYISFDYDVCREVVKIAPYAKVAYLMGDKAPEELVKDHFYGLDYHFSVLQKNPGWIRDAREKKLTVNAWTVNDKPSMEWLLQEKADFITTNEPELLLEMVKGK